MLQFIINKWQILLSPIWLNFILLVSGSSNNWSIGRNRLWMSFSRWVQTNDIAGRWENVLQALIWWILLLWWLDHCDGLIFSTCTVFPTEWMKRHWQLYFSITIIRNPLDIPILIDKVPNIKLIWEQIFEDSFNILIQYLYISRRKGW